MGSLQGTRLDLNELGGEVRGGGSWPLSPKEAAWIVQIKGLWVIPGTCDPDEGRPSVPFDSGFQGAWRIFLPQTKMV